MNLRLSIFDIDKLFPVVKVRGPREPTISPQEQDVSVAESTEPFILRGFSIGFEYP